MNILEAINAAKTNDTVIRRTSWEEGQVVFWKNDVLCVNKPSQGKWERPLGLFTVESVLATDWIEE